MKNKIIVCLLFLLFFITNSDAQILEVNQLFNKKLVKVKQEQIGTVKSFYGTTVIDESKIIDITVRFDGFVTKIDANKQFMRVKKDQTLFSLYSDQISSIQKELHVSKKLNQNLYESSLNKLMALDIHPKEIKRLTTSTNFLDEIDVKSEQNGILLQKNINKGSFVKKGSLLYQVANIEYLWFIAEVYQKDLPFIKQDMQARISLDGETQPIKTSVDYIYPILNRAKKTVRVRFLVENKKYKLYPNMFGEVKIQDTKKSMLTLPKTAVLNKGSNYYVFKPISKEEFEPIMIEAKRISSSKYEIIEGLKVGDEVINNALFLLDSDAVTNGLYEEDDDW